MVSVQEFMTIDRLTQYATALIVFLIFFISKRLITKFIFWIINRFTKNNRGKSVATLLKKIEKPFGVIITVWGLFIAFTIAEFPKALLNQASTAVTVGVVGYGLYQMDDLYKKLLTNVFKNFEDKASNVVVDLGVQVIRLIILVLTIVIICSEFFDISGFIAGLGISGLAIALAAKESVASLFAGVTIILDNPYDVGDWIECDGNSGVVEEINFRSTRLRKFSQEIIIVPNLILASNPIKNYTRRGMRRVKFHLGITYGSTVAQIEKVTAEIYAMITARDDVASESCMVYFESFGASSLDILINYYTNCNDYMQMLAINQTINLEIMRIMENNGVSAAFPSLSVYMENQEETTKEEATA